jgi:branched-chain amino acid aminotransferase
MGLFVYINGKFVKKEEARLSFLDHGFLYGDGIFETLRAYNGRVFKLDEHIERLLGSAKAIHLTIPLDVSEIKEVIERAVEINALREAYIRMTVSRGTGEPGLDLGLCPVPTVVVYAKEMTGYPEEMYKRGVKVAIVGARRVSPRALDPRAKSCNFLNNIMARIEAESEGAVEGIMLSDDGYVTEGSTSNIFIVKDGILITPPTDIGVLPGITRNTAINLAGDSGIEFREEIFGKDELYQAEECFLTNTSYEVMPVVQIDGRRIGGGLPGKTTAFLLNRFRRYVERMR